MFILNIIYFKNIFAIFIIININNLVISDTSNFIQEFNIDYTHALSLLNGNFFLIHQNGVKVYNYNFTSLLYDYYFDGKTLIPSKDLNNNIYIIQCSDDANQYVLVLIYKEIYVFSSRGQYLFNVQNTQLFLDFSNEELYYQYRIFSFLYYKYEGNKYYFIISYINTQKKIKIIYFEIDMNIHSFLIINDISYDAENLISDSVGCQIINNDIYPDKLSCFYAIRNGYKNAFKLSIFDPEKNFTLLNETEVVTLDGNNENMLIKSSIGEDKKKQIIAYIMKSGSTIKYFVFDFNSFKYIEQYYSTGCLKGTILINFYYFKYLNEFILSCPNTNNKLAVIKITYSTQNDLQGDIREISYGNCTNIKSYDMLFYPFEGKLNLITNFNCDITPTQLYNFISIFNYEKPILEPDLSIIFIQTFPTTVMTISKKQIETSTPKKFPTTIVSTLKQSLTTIPITIPKQIPTTIPTIINTTIPKKTPTTIITTIPKKSPTTIPTTIITPIPKKILTSILTTIPKKLPTSIITTILKKTETFISTTIPSTILSTTVIKTPITIITTKEKKSTKLSSIILTSVDKQLSTSISNTQKITQKTALTSIKQTVNIKASTILKNIITSLIRTMPILSTFPISSTEVNECQLKCSKCDSVSLILNLCIECNKNEDFYPSIVIGTDYLECYNEVTKPINYYFNKGIEYYEPCYSYCKTCDYKGDDEINNCTLCKNNYIFRPDKINSTNCVLKCQYYYYINFDQYLCTENSLCPAFAPFLIRNKTQCIEACNNDKEYKFQFNYECLKECPDDTIEDENNVCQIKNKKKCYLYSDSLLNVKFDALVSNNFDILIKKYINGFNDTNYHVDFYKSNYYTITIYKTLYCLKELEMVTSIIDFGTCYKKIKEHYDLEERTLIILIADFYDNKELLYTNFYFFHPDSGEILSIEEVCLENQFIIEKSLKYYQEIDVEQAKFFEDQNINIFNSSDVFYNDLCYYFESPNGKDVPIKERLKLYFPNITFCEGGCNNIGVNLTSMKAICECKLKDLLSGTKDASRIFGFDFAELIESISIDVIRCYKTLFQIDYIKKCYGGFFTLFLIIVQTILVVIVKKKSIPHLKIITLFIVDNYSKLVKSQSSLESPPRKKKNNLKSSQLFNFSENSNLQNETKYKLSQKSNKSHLNCDNEKIKVNIFNAGKKIKKYNLTQIKNRKIYSKLKAKKKSNIFNIQKVKVINLAEYLKSSMDDLDYEETIVRENRKFYRMFLDKLIVKQMIVDIFYNNNWIIPRSIKFIFFILRIDLYIVVNALFYSEEYITELFYSEEKEKFFSFMPRSLNRIIYTSIVSNVLDFIISLLFPSENKIKKILIRKRNNLKEMKIKIYIAIKKIINNYWIFIITSYAFNIISLYYVSCFNNAYPYLKYEWIKSSIFIIILIQIFSIFGCFLYAFFRFISIKCKSQKIFRISTYLLG